MQPIDALVLRHLAAELDAKLAGGKINKIQQPSHHELLLHIWVGGEASRQKLYVNIRPEYAYCALLQDTSFLAFPEKAPNFCMLLRKHLLSACIQQVNTLPDERVMNLSMKNFNEIGQQTRWVLSLELMGKQSNIILYDEELKQIVGCAHGVSEQMSRKREISVGYPYAPPPKPMKPSLREIGKAKMVAQVDVARVSGQDPAQALTQAYSGIGRATLQDLLEQIPDAAQAYDALQEMLEGVHLYPAIHRDGSRYSLLATHQAETDWQGMGTINAMIGQVYTARLLQDRLESMRHQLRAVVKSQEKKLLKRRQEFEKLEPQAIEQLKKAGDCLTIAGSQNVLLSGKRVELTDFETGSPVWIEIDPALSVMDNAQLYYRRYKKAQARQQKASHEIEQLEQMLEFIQELYSSVDRGHSEADLLSVREDLESQGWLKPLTQKKKGARKLLSQPSSLLSSDGFAILVGKSALQNEQLVGKLSNPDDLWLHAHRIPGSHVLIKTERKEVPDSTLLEGAMLAAWFSQARSSVNVPVVYTKARYVRKIPDSYPGHVNYSHEQSVNVTPASEVIAALINRQSPAESDRNSL